VNVALMDTDTTELERARAGDLIEKIDWDAVKPFEMFPEAKNPYGFASTYSTTLMAWRKDAKAPKDWAEFFDTQKFPGKRGLPDYPGYILPMAALADGVEMSKLYPLDLDRAFKALDRIKADTIWWTAGSQAPQLLRDNEVQYSVAWSGRVVTKPELAHSFNQGQLNTSYWVVPKGADPAMKEAAWLYLHEYSDVKNQACITQYIPYTGPSPEIESQLPKDKLELFSTYKPNKDAQFVDDAKWWYENADSVEKRWQEYKLAQ
jgi:putative spermidine/putrescine transport system substrate-binding protein